MEVLVSIYIRFKFNNISSISAMKSNLYLLILVSLLNASNILAQNNLKAQTVYDLIYEGKLNLAFDKVNKLDESNEKHYLKGKLFRLMGKYDEAINSYNQIIKEDNFTDLANQELIDIYTHHKIDLGKAKVLYPKITMKGFTWLMY